MHSRLIKSMAIVLFSLLFNFTVLATYLFAAAASSSESERYDLTFSRATKGDMKPDYLSKMPGLQLDHEPTSIFFNDRISREAYIEHVSRNWIDRKVYERNLPEADKCRINQAQDKAFDQAWTDYQIAINAISSKKFIHWDHTAFDDSEPYFVRNHLQQFSDNTNLIVYEHRRPDTPYALTTIYVGPTAYYLLYSDSYKYGFNQINQSELNNLTQNSVGTIDLPLWLMSPSKERLFSPLGPLLTIAVSNSATDRALAAIDAGADVNKYAVQFGTNPLILATLKGWNHCDPLIDNSSVYIATHAAQRPIIEKLLAHPKLEINAIELSTGMTALHIACLRHDDPQYIQMLLAKSANPTLRDSMGRTALDIIRDQTTSSYEELKRIINEMTVEGQHGIYDFGNCGGAENISVTATIPSREEYERNRNEIIRILAP
ncbi:MAG: ankyrin repeat domain-containing protein [Oligoflexia bacterium]|nr:ankyrin repeat domain-containing protein [Oligoflexia bacterium]